MALGDTPAVAHLEAVFNKQLAPGIECLCGLTVSRAEVGAERRSGLRTQVGSIVLTQLVEVALKVQDPPCVCVW